MKLYKIIKPILNLLILILFASCSTTYEVTRRSELIQTEDLGVISVQTADGKEYTLEHYVLQDSLLICKGTIHTGSKNEPFNGSLNLSKIKKIKATQSSAGKIVLITGISAVMLITIYAVLKNSERGLNNEVVITYPSNCISLNDKFLEDRPMAGGLGDKLNLKSAELDKLKYLDVITGSETAHFKVINDASQIELQMVEQTPADIDDIVTIELKK